MDANDHARIAKLLFEALPPALIRELADAGTLDIDAIRSWLRLLLERLESAEANDKRKEPVTRRKPDEQFDQESLSAAIASLDGAVPADVDAIIEQFRLLEDAPVVPFRR